MEAKLPSRLGIVILAAIAVLFAANHVAARIAFDDGASVATGVAVRAAGTALFLVFLMRLQSLPFALPRDSRASALVAGVLVAVQSYCLYSAVALIPAALALLVFQTCPMLYVLLSWAAGKERPGGAALFAMPLALLGLATALDFRVDALAARWSEIGAGVSWAFGGALSYSIVLYLNANRLKALDGRLRTLLMTGITALLAGVAGGAAGVLAAPAGGTGWLALGLLTTFYGAAMISLFIVLPRVPPASTVALNFEPIALLALAWVFLGQAVAPLQVLGAFVVVGAIAWLGAAKR
jgi:drug/metabolite transporter (DMT)-like permease